MQVYIHTDLGKHNSLIQFAYQTFYTFTYMHSVFHKVTCNMDTVNNQQLTESPRFGMMRSVHTILLLNKALRADLQNENTEGSLSLYTSAEKTFGHTCNRLPSPAPPRNCQETHLTVSLLQT